MLLLRDLLLFDWRGLSKDFRAALKSHGGFKNPILVILFLFLQKGLCAFARELGRLYRKLRLWLARRWTRAFLPAHTIVPSCSVYPLLCRLFLLLGKQRRLDWNTQLKLTFQPAAEDGVEVLGRTGFCLPVEPSRPAECLVFLLVEVNYISGSFSYPLWLFPSELLRQAELELSWP